ncbi:MAG: hypothetical protein AAF004_06035 [Pseudomonadota bacterium]
MTQWPRYLSVLILLAGIPVAAHSADADANKKAASQKTPWQTEQQLTPLADVLKIVSKTTGRQFAASLRVPADVTLGGLNAKNLDYPKFLQILENNNLAAITVSGVTRIIPLAAIRQQPTPFVDLEETELDEGEWVTAVIDTGEPSSARFVPALRPLMPASAHLAAFHDDGLIVISDRLANIRRIAAIITEIQTNSHDNAP